MAFVVVQVLVMAPTRELAKQIADDFNSISDDVKMVIVYGGTPYGPQGILYEQVHFKLRCES